MTPLASSLSLLHDSAGFLQGRPVERWELGILGRTLPPIAADVRAIAQHVQRQVDMLRQGQRLSAKQAVYPAPLAPIPEKKPHAIAYSTAVTALNKDIPSTKGSVAPPMRANSMALLQREVAAAKPVAVARNTVAPKPAVLTRTAAVAPVTPHSRDAQGRFTAKNATVTPSSRGLDSATVATGVVHPLIERLGAFLRDSGHDISQTDPAVQAIHEVATPLARTAQLFHLGGQSREEKRKTRWYRRIWQTLIHSQRNDERFHKAAHQRLKAIEEKPVAENASSGGLFARWLPSLAGLLAPLGKLSALTTGAGAIGSRLLSPVGRVLRPMARAASRFGRRIPVLGSLLGLGMSAWESSSIEADYTLSRDEKNARHGKTWGSAGGGLAGALAGGAAGATLGSIVPVLGNVVGGVLGAVMGGLLGEWLGSVGGQFIGQHFQTISRAATNVFGEIRIVALGTWDWIKASVSQSWHSAMGIFTAVAAMLKTTWQEVSTRLNRAIDNVTGLFSTLWDTLKNVPMIGSVLEHVPSTLHGLADTAFHALQNKRQQAWQGMQSLAGRFVPQGLREAIAQRRFNQEQTKALTTAAQWNQGTIGHLDQAHTRALVASVVETESSGGDLAARNLGGKGYVGRYQAGARWLADAGLIAGGAETVNAAMRQDGIDPTAKGAEWRWAQSGGMDRFLNNQGHWANGLSLQAYMSSAELQDAAFKTHSQRAYQQLRRAGVINAQTPALDVAGLLKARHIAGLDGALQVARGRDSVADANNTSARTYFNQMTRGMGADYARVFAASPSVPESIRLPAPVAVPAVSAPNMPLPSHQMPRVIVANLPPEPGQDVRERGIARIVTGGLAAE